MSESTRVKIKMSVIAALMLCAESIADLLVGAPI